MSDWYQLGQPRRAFFFLTLGGVVGLDVVVTGIWLTLGNWLDADALFQSYVPFLTMAGFSCLLMVGFLGLYRASRYPNSGSPYEEMLLQTPWTPGKRLPFGPWYPMWQDVVPLGVLAIGILLQWCFVRVVLGSHFELVMGRGDLPLLFRGSQIVVTPVIVALTFFGSWLLGGYLAVGKEWKGAVVWPVLVTGAILKVWMSRAEELAGMMAVVAVVVGGILVVRRMKRVLQELPARALAQKSEVRKVQVASVVHVLSPRAPTQEASDFVNQSWPHALLMGAIVAVWYSVLPFGRERYWLALAVIGMLALLRTLSYRGRIQSHLGVLARWGTRKWIVPQYDRCWLPFFWMLAAGFCGVAVALVVPESIAGEVCSVTVGVVVVIGLASGADFERWSLTAPCVYGVGRGNQRNQRGTGG